MDTYLEQCLSLHNDGYETKDIIENLYLNYSSVNDNDLIYKYKKIISKEFDVSLKDIRIIGSYHTNFSKNKTTNDLIEKKTIDEISDFDFAIINTGLFIKYWSMANEDRNEIYNKKSFFENLNNGKFHPKLLERSGRISKQIKEKMNKIATDKSCSVCIYAYEDAFIDSLCFYFEKELTAYFKSKLKKKEKELNSFIVKPLANLGDIINAKRK